MTHLKVRLRGLAAAGACACLAALAIAAPAAAEWGTPEPVESNVNDIWLAPGGTGIIGGFPASNPSRERFALRPFAGPLGFPEEFPSGIGRHGELSISFDASGDAVVIDPEIQTVFWRSANGMTSTPQKFEGHLLARWPRLVAMAPGGAALIGVNEARPGGSPVQLAFRPAGINSTVDTENTVDLTTDGTLIGLLLQADGGALAVYTDEVNDKLMQALRPAGQAEFDAPTEIVAPPGISLAGGIGFASSPSGWAMLTAKGTEGSTEKVVADVRAPGGSFGAPSVIASGVGISNLTPAVTEAGDGLAAWAENHLGNAACPAFGIIGAAEHLGVWSAPMAVGPDAWPDSSIPVTGGLAFAGGNDISVPMARVHRDGSPCPTTAQTRSLIVRHYRSGPSGLTDQGFTELTPLSDTGLQLIYGWAMEPAGRILAWYRVGEERFLRTFDGVTPGAGSGLAPGGPADPGGPTSPIGPTTPGDSGPGAGGSTGAGSGAAGPSAPKPAKEILPLKLQQFAIVPTIDPAALEFEMHCPPTGEESCQGRAYFYYLLTGRQIKPADAQASAVEKRKPTLIATGTIDLKPGAHGKVKMRPNRIGKSLLRSGKKLKVTLKLAVTQGGRSVNGSLPATITAPKHTP
jgi:hypothetical protein